jgi:hypothetical protein
MSNAAIRPERAAMSNAAIRDAGALRHDTAARL